MIEQQERLAGVAEAGSHSIDRDQHGPLEALVELGPTDVSRGADAAQEFHLEVADGIQVLVADLQGALQRGLGVQEDILAGELLDLRHRQLVLLTDGPEQVVQFLGNQR